MNAEINGFTVHTDQPPKYGGEGSAPAPYEYFLASIGTCAGIYVLKFCEKQNIPTGDISLIQRLEYLKTEDNKSYLDKIVLEIIIPPSFPEKHRATLIKVADQFSVKKTIMNPPKFEIKTTVK